MTLFACSEKKDDTENHPKTGTFSIDFSLNETLSKSGGTDYSLDAVTTTVFSIIQNGEYVEGYNKKSLEFTSWDNNSSEVEPISLKAGSYQLSLFELRNADNVTTYATPYKDSEMASKVEKPLNIDFTINADEKTTLNVEVLKTLGISPLKFGYLTISFTDNTPDYQLKNLEKIIGGNFVWKHFVDDRGIPSRSEAYRIDKRTNLPKTIAEKQYTHTFDANNRFISTIEFRPFRNEAFTISISERHDDDSWKEIKWTNAKGAYSKNKFNKDLQYISYEDYNSEGTFQYSREYTYNSEGFITTKKYFEQKNTLKSYVKYKYDDNDNRIESEYYNKDNEYTGSYVYEYNSKNSVVKRSLTDNEHAIKHYRTYEYDDQQRLVKYNQSWDASGEYIQYDIFEYAPEGWLVSLKSFNDTDELVRSLTFDQKGNIISSSHHESVSFIFDAMGRLVGSKTYREDGSLKRKDFFEPNYSAYNDQYGLNDQISSFYFGDINESFYYDENKKLTHYLRSNDLKTYHTNGNLKKDYYLNLPLNKDDFDLNSLDLDKICWSYREYDIQGRLIKDLRNESFINDKVSFTRIKISDGVNWISESEINYSYNSSDQIEESEEIVYHYGTRDIIKTVLTVYIYEYGDLKEYVVIETVGNQVSTKVYDAEGNLIREE